MRLLRMGRYPNKEEQGMTRKHYEAIAKLLGAVGGQSQEHAQVCAEVATKLGDYFKTTNERFDRSKFYNAFSVARSLSASQEWGN
jgi:hypothetical protein